jgi:hypothetical protein
VRRIPTGIHVNDASPLREMLRIPATIPWPPSALPVYQRIAGYASALSTATLVNVQGALLMVAKDIEDAEAKRLKCSPGEVSAKYQEEVAAQKALEAEAKKPELATAGK